MVKELRVESTQVFLFVFLLKKTPLDHTLRLKKATLITFSIVFTNENGGGRGVDSIIPPPHKNYDFLTSKTIKIKDCIKLRRNAYVTMKVYKNAILTKFIN